MTRGLAAALRALGLALEQRLITRDRFERWVERQPALGDESPATPLALRGYLGLLGDRYRRGELPALDVYVADAFTDAERRRIDAMLEARTLDAYRLALDAVDRLGHLECREVRYLENLAAAWRYEDDPDLTDGPRMCDVLSLFDWFLYLYRELEIDSVAGWEAADRACEARNAYLDELDGGAATAAALEAVRAEEREPGRFS